MTAREFGVEIIEARAEEREDIKHPVQPTTKLLPVFKLVVHLAIGGLEHPGVEGFAEILSFISGQG